MRHLKKPSIILLVILALLTAFPMLPVHAIPTGTYFDHIVTVAMENQNYADVMGTGTGNANAPFISSLLSGGVSFLNYHPYGANGRCIGGCPVSGFSTTPHCSAACYTSFLGGAVCYSGYSNNNGGCIQDGSSGDPSNGIIAPTIIDRISGAGLTWQAYCEAGCPRNNDHFAFPEFTSLFGSPNLFTGSSVSISTFVNAANSSTPPNFLWYTPTDCNNMHDNCNNDLPSCNTSTTNCRIPNGDAYLKNFLIGSTGAVGNPAPGSLFATNVFKPAQRTLLLLWWDETSSGGNPSPELLYGSQTKAGTILTDNTVDHYSILRMIEDNWSLSTLTSNDLAATGVASESLITTSLSVNPSFLDWTCTRNGCSPGFQSATLTITSNAPQTYTLSYAYSGVHYPPSWQTQPSTITISSGQTSGTQLLSVKALTCTVQNCYTYINMTAMLGSTPVSSIILTLHSCGFGFCPQS